MKKGLILLSWLIFVFILILPPASLTASRRPVVAKRGMVVSSSRIASEVGRDILKKGGNAVDAAVATSFALAVTYPQAGNIGGGGFMLIRCAETGEVIFIDYREKAPAGASEDMYLDERGEVIPEASSRGYLAVGVPGTVAGLALALERYGTMSLPQVMAPAIRLAEDGFTLDRFLARSLARHAEDFARFPGTAEVFLKNDGSPYAEGELFRQPELARTLRLISAKGPDVFYKGEIAALIVDEMKRGGGLITHNDLAGYRAVVRKPVVGSYRGYTVYSASPPSSGGICLIELLNILENYDLKGMGFGSSAIISLMTEAEKLVYADRAEFLGDPDFVNMPVSGLISKRYASSLRKRIDLSRATPGNMVSHGNPWAFEGEETTHFSVVDDKGNAVSSTYTLNGSYGSKVVVDSAGFLLNNEMDDFAIKPGYPNIYGLVGGEANAIAPGKRMLSSMTPTIISRDGKLFMVIGSPGGSKIITTVLQVILNVIDHGMNIQQAIDAPRVHHQWLPDLLYVEPFAIPADVREALVSRGYMIKPDSSIGDAQGILIDWENGELTAGSDPRGNGAAVGY
jgi:gamma-glutamyltranspeptidase/glutathione hydrolase